MLANKDSHLLRLLKLFDDHDMQDKYAGDVGDFGKFALLRALCDGRQLGICWYRTDSVLETTNDGKHLDYLQ